MRIKKCTMTVIVRCAQSRALKALWFMHRVCIQLQKNKHERINILGFVSDYMSFDEAHAWLKFGHVEIGWTTFFLHRYVALVNIESINIVQWKKVHKVVSRHIIMNWFVALAIQNLWKRRGHTAPYLTADSRLMIKLGSFDTWRY